ncbi:MAG: N-acetylgalactosamine-N,N'-diacetylbacillosaminyl-diphospho-undecaprenol 4-alpha-N-acetylgalactosaminyltransferase [Chroococcidiopsis sp. SAG 2025]|uniref:glycosyltransferase n=1 Tax=Chroococcidiopsis sp. SAG 2025 TaxID=171389 RepID=UPI0029373EDD|nr:glycosyltransferase [Chroococcidiopsis sp. SAG 2025]MDV2991083.1 N-acetylgalactosamine-N,N'-diacetylbacillosaminyl-diphospho-undecaprenol 4-alpha-N-acetylgalactosaminyltransferase [Chroococcidiopsis sp. SAG 2025]
MSTERRIAVFVPNLVGGGAERVVVNLLKGLVAKNIPLDLILGNAEGCYLTQVPKQVRIVNFAVERVVKAILPLSNYLRQEKPYALLSQMNHTNIAAVVAKELARVNTQLVLVEHVHLSVAKSNLLRGNLVLPFVKLLYPRADDIVGVSKGVARDLEVQLGFATGKVNVIYNPIVDDALIAKAKAPLEHPWFQADSPPVFLAVGRLTEQKDFSTLIEAFALLRKQTIAHLLILGEGESRSELEALVRELGIAADVAMPGFVDNPYMYMSRASVFVLSSRWEGLGLVLIEALACGCPAIATDCLSGPREILADGKYGALVPVGDIEALSAAMLKTLHAPTKRDLLIERAMYFSIDRAVSEYLALLDYIH